jgi:DMSO reductase family type II enzyme chaperone
MDAVMNPTTRTAVARSNFYAQLAAGFGYPNREAFAAIADGSYRADLTHSLDLAAPLLLPTLATDVLPKLATDVPYEEFEAAYLGAFEIDMPRPSVSLYEGSYRQAGNKPDLLIELKGFYDNFGLLVAPELHELEDHITAELEFMHFLAGKEAQAFEQGVPVDGYLRAQSDFLRRHLADWLPKLAAEVERRTLPPFFVALATLAARFAVADAEAMAARVERTG